MGLGRAFLSFLFFSPSLFAVTLAGHLTSSARLEIEALRAGPHAHSDLEKAEKRYQTLVHEQLFSDLLDLYAPENAARLQITYPTFVPEGGSAGRDLGYGLHVVKRLELPLDEGTTKVIVVNEQWAQDRASGGLFAPDEIRIKSLVFEGERHVPGSEKLYLFDSIRLSWGARTNDLEIVRRTRYSHDPKTGKNPIKVMRVPVSAPYSCASCHRAGNPYAVKFLGDNEAVDAEAIVQPSYFDRPLTETHGFRDYMAELGREGRETSFVERVRSALLRPSLSLQLPVLFEKLRALSTRTDFRWLDADTPLKLAEQSVWEGRQGTYRRDGKLWLDAIELTAPGKYSAWMPRVHLPKPQR
jgi:hypothetical protein